MNFSDAAIDIGAAQEHERVPAFRLLLGPHAADGADEVLPIPSSPTTGLLVAREGDRIVGAVWIRESMPGVLTVWLPRILDGQSPRVGDALIAAVGQYLDGQNFRLARAFVGTQDTIGAGRLSSIGFQPITTIASLVWTPYDLFETQDISGLRFTDLDVEQDREFAQLMSRTYAQTLDCPALVEQLAGEELLKLYRSTPDYVTVHCRQVYIGDDLVGALVTALDDDEASLEILYFGVVPERRGQGIAGAIVARLQLLSLECDLRRLTVAADVDNWPVMQCYRSAGFTTFAEQELFARLC